MVEAVSSGQVRPKTGHAVTEEIKEPRLTHGFDHPVWALYETQNSFTLTPLSPMCVQASLTIDKLSLKAQEHSKSSLLSELKNIYIGSANRSKVVKTDFRARNSRLRWYPQHPAVSAYRCNH